MPSALFSLYPRGDCFLLSDLGNIFYFIFSDSFGNNKQTHAYYTRAWPDSLLSFVRKPFFLPWPLFPRAQHASCHMSILYFTVKKISGISFLWALPLHLLLPFPLPLSVYFSDPPVLRLLQLSHLVIWGTFFSHLQLWAWEALLGLCLGAVPSCWWLWRSAVCGQSESSLIFHSSAGTCPLQMGRVCPYPEVCEETCHQGVFADVSGLFLLLFW